MSLDRLVAFQGGLKKLPTKNRDRLQASIVAKGFIAPIFVWGDKLLDGHQRVATLLHMRKSGWTIPDLPVCQIVAENEKDAREKLLAISSQYGEFDVDELKGWLADIDMGTVDALRFCDGELVLKSIEEPAKNHDESSAQEIDVDGFSLECKCPRCGMEFDPKGIL